MFRDSYTEQMESQLFSQWDKFDAGEEDYTAIVSCGIVSCGISNESFKTTTFFLRMQCCTKSLIRRPWRLNKKQSLKF